MYFMELQIKSLTILEENSLWHTRLGTFNPILGGEGGRERRQNRRASLFLTFLSC